MSAQGREGSPSPEDPSPEGMGKLPVGWTNVVIEDCLLAYDNGRKIRQGWSPQCEGHPAESHEDWGVLKTSAIQDGFFVAAANKRLPKKLEPRTHLEVEVGDILITCAGPRSRCGVACLVRGTRPKLLISGKMYQLRADPEIIDRSLLELFLREPETQKRIDEMKTGISDSGLNLTHSRFATLIVPLPPLAEQKRIVSKIEELFSELDAGEESLRRARRQLGVYRQSLLKQAFEGKLTEAWRKQNPDLLGSRAAPWRDVVVSDVLTSKPTNGRSVKDRTGGFKVLRLTALKNGKIDLHEYKEGDWEASDAANHVVRKGDFLLSRGNGSIKLVGRGGVVLENADIAFPDTMIRLPLDLEQVDAPFFVYLWNSEQVRRQIENSARTTAGIYKINQSLLTRYRLPLCSLPEQREIVRLLDEQFTVIEQNERELDAALKRSAALRQSILKKAFTGQLVPQDPTDEPASELLERIRKERAQGTAKPTKTKQPRGL